MLDIQTTTPTDHGTFARLDAEWAELCEDASVRHGVPDWPMTHHLADDVSAVTDSRVRTIGPRVTPGRTPPRPRCAVRCSAAQPSSSCPVMSDRPRSPRESSSRPSPTEGRGKGRPPCIPYECRRLRCQPHPPRPSPLGDAL